MAAMDSYVAPSGTRLREAASSNNGLGTSFEGLLGLNKMLSVALDK
jgi:hypothetical protein